MSTANTGLLGSVQVETQREQRAFLYYSVVILLGWDVI